LRGSWLRRTPDGKQLWNKIYLRAGKEEFEERKGRGEWEVGRELSWTANKGLVRCCQDWFCFALGGSRALGARWREVETAWAIELRARCLPGYERNP